MKDAVDPSKLLDKLRKNIERDRQFAQRTEAKLANPGFVSAAPADIVAKERGKLDEARRRPNRRYVEDLA